MSKDSIPEFKYGIYILKWSGHPTYKYRVRRRVMVDGKLQRRELGAKTLSEAIRKAKTLEEEFDEQGVHFDISLTPEEKMAIKAYRAANAVIPLSDWIADGARKEFSRESKLPAQDVVEKFIADITMDNEQGRPLNVTYFKDVCRHVRKFAKYFHDRPMYSISEPEVKEWNRSLKCQTKAKNDYLASIKRVFAFCKLETVKDLPPLPLKDYARGCYTVDEVYKILNYNKPDGKKPASRCFAGMVLSLFCGLRQSEICWHLTWEDINPILRKEGDSQFTVTGKTGIRHPMMPSVAKDWLNLIPAQERKGKIFKTIRASKQGQQDSFTACVRKHMPDGIKARKNAFRHSWATYFVSFYNNMEEAAFLMGNSVAIIRKHYYRATWREEAERFWKLAPPWTDEMMIQDIVLTAHKELEEEVEAEDKAINDEIRRRIIEATKQYHREGIGISEKLVKQLIDDEMRPQDNDDEDGY